MLTQSIEPWLQSLMLLTWKGALLALVVGLAVLLLRRHLSAAWRHGLWLLVLLRFAVPDLGFFAGSLDGLVNVPALMAPVVAPQAVESVAMPVEPGSQVLTFMANDAEPAQRPVMPVEATPPAREVPVAAAASAPLWTMAQKLFLVWLCGALAVLGAMVVLHVRLQRRIRKDASEAFSEISLLLAEACRLARVRRAPRLMVTDAVRAPSLFGVLRPVILLPRQVAAGRDAAALKLILLHELAHLKRRDLWAQIFASCVIALHWFNPLVWMAARRLRAEAEMAADTHALSCTDAREAHRFGEMLLGFSRYATTGWMVWLASATLLGISENKNDLRRRIEGLMDIARGRRTRWAVGMAAFVVLAAIGLTRAPAEDVKKAGVNETAKADEATTTVTGIVVDEDGKPVADAEVKMSINMFVRSEQTSRLTGADGKFRFDAVPKAASLNLFARHRDYAESNFIVFKGINESVERRLVLPKVSWVTGKITDKREGKPIKGAQVFYGTENKHAYSSRFDWKTPFVRTDEAGAYWLPLRAGDLSKIIVRAWTPGMAAQSKVFKITERETTYDVALEPAERIPGKVVNAEGQPVKDALVWVVEDSVRLDESEQEITAELLKTDRSKLVGGKFFISLGSSGADGNVSLPEVELLLKDKLWVVALHPEEGLARMRARDMKAGMVFKLELWASLSGRMIRSDGSPVANTAMSLYARPQIELRSDLESFKADHQIKFTTDQNGDYRIERLMPGSSFTGVSFNRDYYGITPVTVGAGPQKARQIILGSALGCRQSEGVRTVQGRIVLPEGYALSSDKCGVYFSLSSLGGDTVPGMPMPDKNGRFITEPLSPGDYEIIVNVTPKNSAMDLPRDAGRWMRFQIAPGAGQAPLQLDDIVLEKEDLEPKPRPENRNAMSKPAAYVEGAEGKIEITTVNADKNPVPGVKIEVLDFLDHAHNPMGLAHALGRDAHAVSDEKGRATLSFPRMPVAGRRASGVQFIGITQNGEKSRKTEAMDGRNSELRIYPETPVDLTLSHPIVSWSSSNNAGMLAENQPLQDGAVKARLALEHGSHFMLQGRTAEGRVLFSKAIAAGKDRAQEVKEVVKLAPGVEIDGKIEGLPAGDEGDGGVVARVFVKSEGGLNQIMKGYPPNVPWTAWAPVGRDGRFHFKAMPHGMVTLTGVGKGWITRGPLSISSPALINTTGPAEKVSVTLNTHLCTARTVRVLLPDGSPAAGATVQMELPGIGLLAYSRGGSLSVEAGADYAQFKKAPWAVRQFIADDQGQVILENRPAGRTYCMVYWVDPKNQQPHWGSVFFNIEDGEKGAPPEIKVVEK